MFQMFYSQIPDYLAPGYYIFKVEFGKGAGSAITFEGDGNARGCTAVKLERGGTLLIRLRRPTRIALSSGPSTNEPPGLKYLKLWAPFAALVKSLKPYRARHRIPMLDRAGYICVLDGIGARDKLPVISRNATLQRSLWPLGLDNSSVPSHHLFDHPLAWLHKPESPPVFAPKGRTGVFLHLYYSELWPEFAAFLNQIQHPFDLWITHCGLSSPACKQILEVFPQAEIVQVENRGRDIWPFISFLNDGILDKYEYICKIHSKKSVHRPGMEEGLFGSRWRRRALYDLLAAGRAEHIVGMFDCDPSLGIAGPRVLRVPNTRYTSQMAWGPSRNWDVTFRLARRMGMQMAVEDLDFFAGSMFWVRPVALEPIRRLNLQRDDFPDEAGQLNGEVQHALERLFTASAVRAGLSIAETAPLAACWT